MKAASGPRRQSQPARLLVIDPEHDAFEDRQIGELPQFFRRNDSLVCNDAGTLPASLHAGEDLELRLVQALGEQRFRALALGHGTSRMPTESRGPAPRLALGARLEFGFGLSARVIGCDPEAERLLEIEFEQSGAEWWQALYRAGRPIQYAYVQAPLELWDVQNGYAARPWAFELPSAGKPLSFELLFRIRAQGVHLGHLTHAAGISSTGDEKLDLRLPFAERYELSARTAAELRQTRARGGRVIAVGTSVVRALEAASLSGELRSGSRVTSLRLGPGSRLRTCSGLITGVHEPKTSHFSLLEAFAPRGLLARAFAHAERSGYLQHEFGDACLVLRGALGSGAELLQAG